MNFKCIRISLQLIGILLGCNVNNCFTQVVSSNLHPSISLEGESSNDILLNDSLLQDSSKLKPTNTIWIVDGVPIISSTLSGDYITPELTDFNSFSSQWDTLFNYEGQAQYYRIFKVCSKKSITKYYPKRSIHKGLKYKLKKTNYHEGLKYILKKTDYWIYENPLAVMEVNGININDDPILLKKLCNAKKNDISRIRIYEEEKNSNMGYGVIRLNFKY